eukprot:3932785-Pleurochrysis_carterae.AAC.6
MSYRNAIVVMKEQKHSRSGSLCCNLDNNARMWLQIRAAREAGAADVPLSAVRACHARVCMRDRKRAGRR